MQWHREDERKGSSTGPRELKTGRVAAMNGGLRGRTQGNRLTLVPMVRESVVTGFTHIVAKL